MMTQRDRRDRLPCALVGVLLVLGGAPVVAGSGVDKLDSGGNQANQRWGRNYFPNVELITHNGKKVRFFDDLIKDKVVVINFIYTTCPDTCPLETARLLEVQRILGDRVGRDVFMYSISIDPKTDTPEVLHKYVELYGIGPGWTFLTGKEEDIILLRKRLGLYIDEIQDGSLNHNLSMIVGNQATGRWMKSSPFENPYFLAREIGAWLHNWKMPPRTDLKYEDAPELRKIGDGEDLYRKRCAACHTIGGGDINEPRQRRVGPDLLGVVAKRDRAWLARWIAQPDKVLAEGDPIAVALLAKYSNLPMPNIRINPLEVAQLIEYMETESHRVERIKTIQTMALGKGVEPKSCCSKKKKNKEKKAESSAVLIAADAELKPSVVEFEPPNGGPAVGPNALTAAISAEGVTAAELSPATGVVDAAVDGVGSGEADQIGHGRGFVTVSMVVFGALGFGFLYLGRVLRRTV